MYEVMRALVTAHEQYNAGPDAEARFREIAIRARSIIAKAEGKP
jgi:hypothetical protein